MSKGKRLRHKRKGVGKDFSNKFSDRLTKNFQNKLRKSEIWDQMVKEFGEERAKELLDDIKAEVKPGPVPDESWDSTKDIS